MTKTAIIAAMPQELQNLVQGWTAHKIKAQKRNIQLWENEKCIAACAGIGMISARVAAETAWQHGNGSVRQFISAGYAGALIPELKVAEIFEPEEIVESVDEQRLSTLSGNGVLATAGAIAGTDFKRGLAAKYHARAVDMEAYAVGDVAKIYNVPFRAIKAISDEFDFPMPPMGEFVDDFGQFHIPRLLLYAVFRPTVWKPLIDLGRNSAKANISLTAALRRAIDE
jgi:nucleoside phosphorylase